MLMRVEHGKEGWYGYDVEVCRLEDMLEEHHLSYFWGYISRRTNGEWEEYKGRFGEGYLTRCPCWHSTMYSWITYYTKMPEGMPHFSPSAPEVDRLLPDIAVSLRDMRSGQTTVRLSYEQYLLWLEFAYVACLTVARWRGQTEIDDAIFVDAFCRTADDDEDAVVMEVSVATLKAICDSVGVSRFLHLAYDVEWGADAA